MRDGNDTVTINVNSDYAGDFRSYLVDLGEGHDDAFYTAQDLTYGTSVDMEFDCDGGNDDVTVNVQNLRDSSLVIEGHGDSGSDDFVVNIEDVGELPVAVTEIVTESNHESRFGESTVDIEIDTSSANYDTINTSLDDVRPGSLVFYDLKAGSGNDTVGMLFTGIVNGDVNTTVALDSGNDRLDVLLNEEFSVGQEFKDLWPVGTAIITEPGIEAEGNATFNLSGNDGNDRMTVKAGPRTDTNDFATAFVDNSNLLVAELAQLRIRMIGGTGADILTADFATDAGIELEGLFYLRMDGSHGADCLLVRIDLDEYSDGNLDGEMRGGESNDKLYLFLNDPTTVMDAAAITPSLINGGVHYGPSGRFLQDGGTQTDTGYTEFNGDPLGPGATMWTPIHRRNIENILLIDPT